MNSIKEGYIKVNNSNLFYSVTGQGEPLIFIHGNFNDSRIWEYQMDSFSSNYEVIRYDLRGYGKSDSPTSTFSHFEDLKALLDSLGKKKVTIVASSLGGSVAVDFTLKYPEYVKALVLVAPAVNGFSYPIRLMIQAMKSMSSLKSKGFEVAVERFINNPFWAYFIPSQENQEARELVLKSIRTQKNFYSWNFNLAIRLKPVAARRLKEIQAPTLVVLAENDIDFNVKVGKYIHQEIKNSKKVIISDVGHLPFVEKPEEFNWKVLDFLKGTI